MKAIKFVSTPEYELEINKFDKNITYIKKKLENQFLSQRERNILENELDIAETYKNRYVVVTQCEYEIEQLKKMMPDVEIGSDEYREIQHELDMCEMTIDEVTL